MDQVESSIFVAPGTVRSSDDLEEDTGDHKVLSRYFINIFSPPEPLPGELLSNLIPFPVSDWMGMWGQGWTTRETDSDKELLHTGSPRTSPQNQEDLHLTFSSHPQQLWVEMGRKQRDG